ncbi:hypothetical protein JHK82_040361 [Glycine max]|nr:hypothetical protein JHK82_040361 [Glycine max]
MATTQQCKDDNEKVRRIKVRSGVVGHGAKAGATGRVNCKGGATFGKVSKRDTIDAANGDAEDAKSKKPQYEGPDPELAAMLERDMLETSPGVRRDDFAGLTDAKRLLEEETMERCPHVWTSRKTLLAKADATECGTTFNFAPGLKARDWSLVFRHTLREDNACAHWLANYRAAHDDPNLGHNQYRLQRHLKQYAWHAEISITQTHISERNRAGCPKKQMLADRHSILCKPISNFIAFYKLGCHREAHQQCRRPFSITVVGHFPSLSWSRSATDHQPSSNSSFQLCIIDANSLTNAYLNAIFRIFMLSIGCTHALYHGCPLGHGFQKFIQMCGALTWQQIVAAIVLCGCYSRLRCNPGKTPLSRGNNTSYGVVIREDKNPRNCSSNAIASRLRAINE